MAQADFTRISSNIAALNSLNSLRGVSNKLGTAQLRLATGRRINMAADDPSGITIAMKMRANNESLKAALGNLGDAKNMLSVAESGLQKITDILTEMKAKATSAATETIGNDERTAIKNQLQSLARQINDIVVETKWNNEILLGGSLMKVFQTGANAADKTVWSLSQSHSATGEGGFRLGTSVDEITIGVSAGYTNDDSYDNSIGDGSGVAKTNSAWLSTLASGVYEFNILDVAEAADTGKANNDGGDWGKNVVLAGTATPTAELSSGKYRMHIDTSSADGLGTYTIYDVATGIKVAQSTNEVDFTGGVTDVIDTNGNTLGFSIDDSIDLPLGQSSIKAGNNLYFEYIAGGFAKVELNRVTVNDSGVETLSAIAVDADGSNQTTNATRNFFYAEAGSTYNTGRGFEVTLGDFGDIAAGEVSRFDLTEAGEVIIQLGSAAQANSFMDIVDAAVTIATQSLTNVGAMYARLSAKEDMISVAQINTEASFNRIMSADMAFEQVEATKFTILQQTSIAMLSQTNMAPQGILSLFR